MDNFLTRGSMDFHRIQHNGIHKFLFIFLIYIAFMVVGDMHAVSLPKELLINDGLAVFDLKLYAAINSVCSLAVLTFQSFLHDNVK